jgi:hypothetical protein
MSSTEARRGATRKHEALLSAGRSSLRSSLAVTRPVVAAGILKTSAPLRPADKVCSRASRSRPSQDTSMVKVLGLGEKFSVATKTS